MKMDKFNISEIEDVWIAEASSEEITELPENFYEKAGNYSAEISGEIDKSEDLRKELLEKELEQVIDFVQDIYLFRILKMMDSLLENEEPELIEKEQNAFDEISTLLKNLKEELVDPVLEREPHITPPDKHTHLLVLITSKIPMPITGPDLKNYGPFKKGEITNIPKKTGELLLKQNLAKEIKLE